VIAANVGAPLEHAPLGGGEALWAAVSFGIAVVMVTATALLLRGRRLPDAEHAPAPSGFHRVLYDKWYVDEIYDALVVRPIMRVSRAAWRFIDEGLIDGIVNGLGYTSRAFGWVGARMQTGQLNTYAFAVVAGALLLLAFVVLQ
jgi:NADH-quinone oxidoreductase subunit L